MDATLSRKIKIHCPEHHTTFETADNPKIVCEIREHALSTDFPNAEFWEYCCDCQIFSPSDLEVGGKASDACRQCERTALRRFVCGECKIISTDSGEDTKGKMHRVSDANVVEPSCPGCRKTFSGDKSHLHKCAEAEAVIATTREVCPFCKKITAKPKKVVTETAQTKCRKCQTLNAPNFYFCRECGEELRPNENIAKRGSTTAKTQLLGSLCPTCGAGNPTDSVFCANCGQALKAEPERAIPPQPLPESSVPTEVFTTGAFGGTPSPKVVKPKSSSGAGLTAGGILLVLAAACCVCFNSKSKNTDLATYSQPSNTSYTPSNYSSTPSNAGYGNSTVKNSNLAMSNKMMNGNSSGNSSVLSASFDNEYSGTIGGRGFSMSLKRSGSDLRGTARTSRTDYLYGTIDDSGSFTLKGYENDGSVPTGTYSGKIYTDGSVSGTWKNPQGGQATTFSLTED